MVDLYPFSWLSILAMRGLSLCSIFWFAALAAGAGGVERSTSLIKEDIDRVVEDLDEVEDALKIVDEALSDLNYRKKEILDVTLDLSKFDESLKSLRGIVEKWRNAAVDYVVPVSEIYSYEEAVQQVYIYPIRPLYREFESIQNEYFSRLYFRGSEPVGREVSVLKAALRRVDSFDYYNGESDLDRFSGGRLLNDFLKENYEYIPTRVQRIKEGAEGVWKEVSGPEDLKKLLDESLSSAKVGGQTWVGSMLDELSKLSEKNAVELEELRRRRENLDAEYRQAQEREAKSEKLTSSYQDLSVNFMIGGIILILIVLLVLSKGNEAIATSLIERRTLVEILSMGFLLLAVIILGTSDKIKAEILGTILGTIAGYVFGRQTSQTSIVEK